MAQVGPRRRPSSASTGHPRRSPGRAGASGRRPGDGSRTRPAGSAGPRQAARRLGATAKRSAVSGALARRSTRRLAMLGGVFVLLAVMLVPPLRALLVQQQEYRDLQASVSRQEATVGDLKKRADRWNDPAYIEQQSRERLNYVRPGEKAYVVVGAESLVDKAPRDSLVVIDPSQQGPRSWYSRIWDSVETGDGMGSDPNGAPVSRLDGNDNPDDGPTSIDTPPDSTP